MLSQQIRSKIRSQGLIAHLSYLRCTLSYSRHPPWRSWAPLLGSSPTSVLLRSPLPTPAPSHPLSAPLLSCLGILGSGQRASGAKVNVGVVPRSTWEWCQGQRGSGAKVNVGVVPRSTCEWCQGQRGSGAKVNVGVVPRSTWEWCQGQRVPRRGADGVQRLMLHLESD